MLYDKYKQRSKKRIVMEEYKSQYNNLLNRYNKGILYLEQNPNMLSKWGKELEKIMEDLSKLIVENSIPEEYILKGFDV